MTTDYKTILTDLFEKIERMRDRNSIGRYEIPADGADSGYY